MVDLEKLRKEIIAACKTVEDPEIPVDIYELGLIYSIDIKEDGLVIIEMTLTTPMCPVADSLPLEVQQKVMELEHVQDVDLRVVFDPKWEKSMMSEEASFVLDMM
ncbi:MAG: iron-sulfur cluster assembly protein [Saprospiraceae bacterium]|nr:iron-sulfur cluster assembly protein [Saprospiraceae bacterium]